jgi:phosphoribosylglycinamide formyltransferase 1
MRGVSAFRIVVLASGSGTNLQAILNKLHGGDEGIEVVGVGSDKEDAGALDRARRADVEAKIFAGPEYEDREFRNRVINVHPALLPSFPGIDAVQQAIDHGSKVTGVTVHFVDEGMDSGPIIMQRAVPVAASRDWDETESQIHAAEHDLLPEAIRLIAAGRVRLDETNPRLVLIDPES